MKKTNNKNKATAQGSETKRLGTRKVPKEQRMIQILEVAGSVFSRHGFHSTSMEQIAEGAGVTKPLLYRYFGSKDALYLATITQVGNHLMSGLSLLMENPDPEERLKMIMHSFLTFVERHREGWSVLYNEALTSVGPVGEKVAFFRNSFIEASAKTIEELNDPSKAKNGDKAGIQAVALANIMVGAVEAGARWWIQHPDIPIRDMQRLIETSLMPGLSKR
ncbi:MAG: TetR/AcrR family transcriptional regulator [Gammaproteobacteria bacterium]|uniref:TetR/AcrR family transcriptional regulator n=1 Tax=Limnobacter sp. TaxID=2003368 RepID=UPI001DA6E614|nr:TetR/AcrR family transcriptional regulator [Limnobacter sp.]MBU0782512.1 TetR/AcrR family transcriptional regulator [Gammaproteobacteria bacterium]MBU0850100.1 TetR/AcrR family transcriptional regulator [Gammaproteobacteria bacterium]MBU1268588.1 TetR/AcrR family transcriptional regulator [Gammaproteobacteria bacterium]MBU1780929.1 TetR/AcrR family transcriptional regulator [Gammaproteobacteria bacterium]MBU2087252.1 TetR/AcrR family transcriptional regulator [Gammaproteobacteria bacterium]